MTDTRNRRQANRLGVGVSAVLALVLTTATPALAVDLKWSFKTGESQRYRLETKTISEVSFPKHVTTTMLLTTETTWSVGSIDDNGDAEIALRFDRFQFRADTPKGRIDYDTAADLDASKEPAGLLSATLVPTYKALAGSTFLYTMTPLGDVRDIRIPSEVITKLKEAVETSADSPRFSEEAYKYLVRDQILIFPGKDLKRGDTWGRQTKVPSPTGLHVHEKTYTYGGPDESSAHETIRLKVFVGLQPAPNSSLDIKIDAQEDNATYLFDNQDGHLVQSTRGQTFKVIYTLKAGPRRGQSYNEKKTVASSLKRIEAKTGSVASK